MSIYICGGTSRFERRQMTCPACHIGGSWVVSSLASSAWWGTWTTCTNCGESWSEGEFAERPFRRGWRQKAIKQATESFEVACDCRAEYDASSGWELRSCEHQAVAA